MWSEVGLWVLRVRSGIRWRNGEWRVNGVVLRRNLAVGIVEKEESDMADRGERRRRKGSVFGFPYPVEDGVREDDFEIYHCFFAF